MKLRTRFAVLGALVAVVLVGAGTWVFAQTDGAIHACYKNKGGQLRIVGSEDDCRENETHLVWNIVGPPGTDGEDGTSCSVVQGVGEATIQCTDDTLATVRDGAPGPPGPPGPPADPTELEERLAYLECELFGESCPYRLVFISSEGTDGRLGPLDGRRGPDEICQGLATDAGLVTYGKVFKGWVSTDRCSPSTCFVQSDVPYVRVDGVQVAADWADLVDGTLAAPINVDAWGVGDYAVPVWTGTTAEGTLDAPPDCNNWHAGDDDEAYGVVAWSWRTDAAWTDAGDEQQWCGDVAHLYCFQQ